MADTPAPPATVDAVPAQPPVVVKKYANRRLYNTETSSYITLDNLAEMIRAGRDFVVYDAKSGDDITRGVLTQIIVEEESKGSAMLPTNFLRQLIGFYGGNLQGVVPNYLEQAMASFSRQQQQMRQVVQQTFGPFMPVGVEEMGRQNMAMIERAMTMFNPFHRQGDALRPATAPDAPGPQSTDVEALRHEIDNLRAQLAIARAEAVVQTALAPPAALASAPFLAEPALAPVLAPASVHATPALPHAIAPAVRHKVRAVRKPT